jgi:hypothetical protein
VRKADAGGPIEMGFPPVYQASKPRLNIKDVGFALPLITASSPIFLLISTKKRHRERVPAFRHLS